ncbi:MAG: enoyl-CoA hydratase/isomerase family protein [Desulfarculus sp.]|nr:enoyl-CoA hydratase/isomerase family protein [Pseudomonadota bacterium]MBU4574281.1 enoyl-CoA hydratase/isomerase family protein [Pseudomonadota bacterium]MBU4596275.1 enoyl-CoA hydratase/isomerase family protein [Pseudomonadota bacterium]MBV1715378.1 enoyl-CoA hydratase/isomerase family protein [Desulfarculus sp.]MBV1737573.1 enoyl-CoA hydratase/isomerase family protein [Desulfarculus sp.]
MSDQEVIFEVEKGGVAVLTLNRPDRYNAVTRDMTMNVLPGLFDRVQQDPEIRVLILTGAGKGFCTGADVQANLGAGLNAIKNQRRVKEEPVGGFTQKLAAISKPVIAAINGAAAGVGLSMALLADFRIASEQSKYSVIFVRRGLMPDGGSTYTLPLVVGLPKALELALTGDVIDAQEALRIGLVNKLVPPESLMDEALAFAGKLAANPPLAMSFTKRALRHNLGKSFQEGLLYESWGQNVLYTTQDHQEGIKAFMEKREPKFTGE